MLIVSQYKDKTTESLELTIKEVETCKNIFIDTASYEKFKKITQKKEDNTLTAKELKGLGELLGKNITKNVYTIIEKNNFENLGTFSSKEKAKEVLKKIIQAYEKETKKYEIPQDENAELILF